MYCKECGAEMEFKNQRACLKCGCTEFEDRITSDDSITSEKSRLVTLLLWFFLGGIGAHHYYAGNFIKGIAITILAVTNWFTSLPIYLFVGTILLYDLGYILRGQFKDVHGCYITKW